MPSRSASLDRRRGRCSSAAFPCCPCPWPARRSPTWMPSSSRSWHQPRRSGITVPPGTSWARCSRRPSSWGRPHTLASRARRNTPRGSGTRCRLALRPLLWLGALGATGTFLFAETAVGLIYGAGFAPAATILKVYAPVLFLVFIDILLGNTMYAAGAAVGFAVVLAVKVLVSAGLSLVLVPLLQARTENGGIGIVLSFALSELVVLSGALVLLPRGTLTAAAAVDAARALGSAVLTMLVFRLHPRAQSLAGHPALHRDLFRSVLAAGADAPAGPRGAPGHHPPTAGRSGLSLRPAQLIVTWASGRCRTGDRRRAVHRAMSTAISSFGFCERPSRAPAPPGRRA